MQIILKILLGLLLVIWITNCTMGDVQVTAERIFPSNVTPDSILNVTIVLDVYRVPTDFILREYTPSGWEILYTDPRAFTKEGEDILMWSFLLSPNEHKELRYGLKVPERLCKTQSFSGEILYIDEYGPVKIEIGGDKYLNIFCEGYKAPACLSIGFITNQVFFLINKPERWIYNPQSLLLQQLSPLLFQHVVYYCLMQNYGDDMLINQTLCHLADPLYCEKDSDCICTPYECFSGNREYVRRCLDKSQTWMDCCYAWGDYKPVACIENKCSWAYPRPGWTPNDCYVMMGDGDGRDFCYAETAKEIVGKNFTKAIDICNQIKTVLGGGNYVRNSCYLSLVKESLNEGNTSNALLACDFIRRGGTWRFPGIKDKTAKTVDGCREMVLSFNMTNSTANKS